MAGCPKYTTGINRRSAEGLICCTGLTQWKDLDAKIDGWSWVWLCPTCGGWLRRDPWTPPADLPQPLQRPENAGNGLEGIGVHRAVWSAS